MFETIPFQNICDALDKSGISEYMLKYLYITDGISVRLKKRYPTLLIGLKERGLIKESGGKYSFYHNSIREAVGRTLEFTVEDYADIFADSETDNPSKAICALNRPEEIRDGGIFLRSFFSADNTIYKKSRRYELCLLVFDHLDILSSMDLGSSALAYVRNSFHYLNEECGHSTFFYFLKHIADTALTTFWDTDENSVESMAFFVKKFFDRALSSYRYEECLHYYEKFEEKIQSLQHISEERRYFWRSHYANRVAIALDRSTVPLAEEPPEVAELYHRSWEYCNKAGCPNELVVQNAVDTFNRHYIYRHDLSPEIVKDTFERLRGIQSETLIEPMVMKYHLLLLEFLRYWKSRNDEALYALLGPIRYTYEKSTTEFYTLKLFILEIYVLAALGQYAEAVLLLSRAEAFAYKKEMRTYIYRITYTRANLMILANSEVSNGAFQQIVLAFEQMLDSCGENANRLKREAFLLKRLIRVLGEYDPRWLQNRIAAHQFPESRELLQIFYRQMGKVPKEIEELLRMESYFVFGGISFPAI